MGVYLIVRSLALAAGGLSAQPLVIRESDAPFADHINSMLFSGCISLAVVVVFGLVPGSILIAKSKRWAELWVPDDVLEDEIGRAHV